MRIFSFLKPTDYEPMTTWLQNRSLTLTSGGHFRTKESAQTNVRGFMVLPCILPHVDLARVQFA